MKNPEYFIANMIETKLSSGLIVEKWPLHITIAPPFELLGVSESTIIEHMAEYGRKLGVIKLGYGAIRSGAIPIEIGNEDMFGENYDIPVIKIIDPSNKLHELHSKILNDLQDIGCNFINLDPRWSGANYSPHATVKNGTTVDRPFFCTAISLGKKHLGEKIIVDTVNLCGK